MSGKGTIPQANIWSGKGIVDLEIYGLLKADYLANAAKLEHAVSQRNEGSF